MRRISNEVEVGDAAFDKRSKKLNRFIRSAIYNIKTACKKVTDNNDQLRPNGEPDVEVCYDQNNSTQIERQIREGGQSKKTQINDYTQMATTVEHDCSKTLLRPAPVPSTPPVYQTCRTYIPYQALNLHRIHMNQSPFQLFQTHNPYLHYQHNQTYQDYQYHPLPQEEQQPVIRSPNYNGY